MPANVFARGFSLSSEIPGESALDGVGLDVRGKIALVEGPELGLRGKAPVKAAFDERRVTRDWNAGNREASARALEGERRRRRHVAEGVLPLQAAARDQHRAVRQRDEGCRPQAQEGIAEVLVAAGAGQRSNPAALEE